MKDFQRMKTIGYPYWSDGETSLYVYHEGKAVAIDAAWGYSMGDPEIQIRVTPNVAREIIRELIRATEEAEREAKKGDRSDE